jgi:hypothetical protein
MGFQKFNQMIEIYDTSDNMADVLNIAWAMDKNHAEIDIVLVSIKCMKYV